MKLVEATRPVFYRSMKYWGKKPHNIWSYYIQNYSSEGDSILDPFAGSGMTFFESAKANRHATTIDINPLTDFFIKSMTNQAVDLADVENQANAIIAAMKNKDYYKKEYSTKCSHCGQITDIYNYKKNGTYSMAYKCEYCNNTLTHEAAETNSTYKIEKWCPDTSFDEIKSVNKTFLNKLKSNYLRDIWSNRNLKIMSELYDMILDVENENTKELLVLAFMQCAHLTTRMCIPRNAKSKRPLSTSWGRPAYLLSAKEFEQNPVLAFQKAVFNKTGVLSAYKNAKEYLANSDSAPRHYLGDAYNTLKGFPDSSFDLIITDPPYGSIIQYGDLSEVWVSWLAHYDSKYRIDHDSEIIKNKCCKNDDDYIKGLSSVFGECNRVLKNGKNVIVTFNSREYIDWVDLFRSLQEAQFAIKEIVYQKNRRASEANVGAKNGIAISDYYLICEKGKFDTDKAQEFLEGMKNG